MSRTSPALLAGTLLLAAAHSLAAEEKPPAGMKTPADPYASLPYRFIGPPGNRVSAEDDDDDWDG